MNMINRGWMIVCLSALVGCGSQSSTATDLGSDSAVSAMGDGGFVTDAGTSSDLAGADASAPGEVRAFPGAEGFGAMVTGGRGGAIIRVTTLSPSGPGSLQAALDAPGPRIIVFAVSGVIAPAGTGNAFINIPHGDVTIAGQTAPGQGITIRGQFFADYDTGPSNIIVRHIRVRPVYDGSDTTQFDAIQFSTAHHFILDHVSASGAADETVDIYSAHDATVQWSAIESSTAVVQPGDTTTHNYGLINGPDGSNVSVHHVLFAHHRVRSPAIANGPAEIVNNVIYNGSRGFVHNNPASGPFNIEGNLFKDGPSDSLAAFYFDAEAGSNLTTLKYFLSGNVAEGTGSCTAGSADDPWTTCDIVQEVASSARASTRHGFLGVGDAYRPATTTSASVAYTAVLAHAGAFPRDFITTRSVSETMAGTGAYDARYNATSDFLAGLTSAPVPPDADGDGIPDDWETQHGLSPSNPADAKLVTASGYTAIEDYINARADAITP